MTTKTPKQPPAIAWLPQTTPPPKPTPNAVVYDPNQGMRIVGAAIVRKANQ